ncbi:MAG: hypothetical protein ACK5DO_29110, partial [Bradyrhizobium sp.]
MFEISPTEWTAILLSLRVAVIATLVATPFGIALAWLLARRDCWGKSLLDAAVHLPLLLPPVVTGYLLLLTFGKRGLVDGFDRQADRPHQQRKRHHAAGERRAGPAEREHDAEMIGEPAADQSALAERKQQQVAGDDRRQHQRQVHGGIEQRL